MTISRTDPFMITEGQPLILEIVVTEIKPAAEQSQPN